MAKRDLTTSQYPSLQPDSDVLQHPKPNPESYMSKARYPVYYCGCTWPKMLKAYSMIVRTSRSRERQDEITKIRAFVDKLPPDHQDGQFNAKACFDEYSKTRGELPWEYKEEEVTLFRQYLTALHQLTYNGSGFTAKVHWLRGRRPRNTTAVDSIKGS